MEDLIYEWTDPVFALIFGGVCPAIFLGVAISILREARAARHWLPVTATVVDSRDKADRKKSKTAAAQLPLWEYEYTVNEQTFRSSQTTRGGKFAMLQWG